MLAFLALVSLVCVSASPIDHVAGPHDLSPRQMVANSSGAPTVTLKNGSYYGFKTPGLPSLRDPAPLTGPELGVEAFLGMPYGNAPRFAHPTSLNSTWTETRNATSFGDICAGYGPSSSQSGYTIGEECLSINIIRPAGTTANASLPTHVGGVALASLTPIRLFWIFGGGFVQGTGRDTRYNGSYLVQRSVKLGTPIIYASINYRLAAFGFLSGSQMQNASALNAGLYDQRLALRWLKENGAAFGADPSRTTVFGQSAGGASVVFQAFAYGGQQDLFHQAIVHSGGYSFGRVANATSGQMTFDKLANATGCSGADALSCLRTADFQTLFAAANGTSAGPVPDGALYPAHGPALAQGRYSKIPMIVGNVNDEGTSGTSTPTGLQNQTTFNTFLRSIVRLYDNATFERAQAAFPDNPEQGSPFGTGAGVLSSGLEDKRANWVTTDFSFVANRRLFAQQASSRQPIYSYRFDQIPQNGTIDLGVSHFYDVPYVFGILDRTTRNPLGNRPADLALSADIQTRWINFVANGDPNSGGKTSVYWPQYSSGQQQIVFNNYTHIEKDDYRTGSIDFVNGLWDKGSA